MAARKPKIVVVKEDFGAAQVAEESVGAVVKAANIMNAVDTMATDFMPDEKSVLHNDELGLVFTELTDAEAKSLMGKPGVESVEDDEVVYALQSDEPGLPGDDGSLDEELLEEDLEASAEIDEALSEYEDANPEDFELITPEVAAIEAQREPEVDEFDIDDNGEIISLDDTMAVAGEAATGIPRDTLIAIVKCIIKCALQTASGQVAEVSDEKINEILGAHGASGGSSTVQAVRDYITCGLRIITHHRRGVTAPAVVCASLSSTLESLRVIRTCASSAAPASSPASRAGTTITTMEPMWPGRSPPRPMGAA